MHLDLTLHTMPRLGGHGRKLCPFPRRSTWQWTQAKCLGERFVQVPLGSFALVGVRLHYVIQALPDEGSTICLDYYNSKIFVTFALVALLSYRQGCIICFILPSGMGARGVSLEHMENMKMFSCSSTCSLILRKC